MTGDKRSMVERLLDAFLPRGPRADAVRGDLHQEFESRRRAGAFSARAWYLRQALSVVLWSAFDRMRGRAWELRSSIPRLGAATPRRPVLDVVGSAASAMIFAGRRLRRAPAFTTTVVLILALGIGANALMFGVVDRLLLSPPHHIVDEESVRLLHVVNRPTPAAFIREVAATQRISYPDYLDFLDIRAFADVAAYTFNGEETIGTGPNAHRAWVTTVTPNLFSLLGVQPSLGRFFPLDEDELAGTPSAVLSHEYWGRAWGGESDIIGRTIAIGRESRMVIGIAPPGFTGVELASVDIWLPLLQPAATASLMRRDFASVQAVARLTPSATVQAAEAEATTRHLVGRAEMIRSSSYPSDAAVLVAPVIAARGPTPTSQARVARWLASVSLIVLLIACLNVANLHFAQSVATRQQVAIRATLGIGRWRLMGESLAQSLALAMLAAAASVAVLAILTGAVHATLLPNVAPAGVILSARTTWYVTAATFGAGLLSGMLPALQAVRTPMAAALRSGGQVASHSKTRGMLLVGQVALSSLLLVGAALFVRSVRAAETLDLGFDARAIAVASLEFTDGTNAEERRDAYERVIASIERVPGVRRAALTVTVPFRSTLAIGVRMPGDPGSTEHDAFLNKVTSGYFESMGVAVIEGRVFEPQDDAEDATPVAVITESMARAIWPTEGALGECMIVASPMSQGSEACTEVVGIVENHRLNALLEEPLPMYFLNQSHPGFPARPGVIVIGTSGDPDAVLAGIRAAAAEAASSVRFANVVAMRDYIEPELRSWRMGARALTGLGFLALIVAAVGLYGVLACDVALRRRELGIRSALGARVSQIAGVVVGQALGFTAAGLAVGLGASAAASRVVDPLLFQVSATDAPSYAIVALTLLVATTLAGSLPAWRATRVDPREALQAD